MFKPIKKWKDSDSLTSKFQGRLKCVSSNNGLCQTGPRLADTNSYGTLFYPFKKCGGRYNAIDDPYTRVCVSNKVKNMNAKVFNLCQV